MSKSYSTSLSVIISDSAHTMFSMSGVSAGAMRYNGDSGSIEVYDGYTWMPLSTGSSVGLSPTAEESLAWAEMEMSKQKALEAKLKENPGLKEAYDQFKMLEALIHVE